MYLFYLSKTLCFGNKFNSFQTPRHIFFKKLGHSGTNEKSISEYSRRRVSVKNYTSNKKKTNILKDNMFLPYKNKYFVQKSGITYYLRCRSITHSPFSKHDTTFLPPSFEERHSWSMRNHGNSTKSEEKNR
jgi:hypothetical protein